MTIRDKTALRFAWEELRFWERESDPKAKEIIRREKKAIRKYNHNNKQINKCIHNDEDSAVYMIQMPDKVKSLEAADKYFKDHYYYCLSQNGNIFTNWYKIIKRNGKYIAYQSITMNI